MTAHATPQRSDSEPVIDPRRQALDEWEAVQVLCESLGVAGITSGPVKAVTAAGSVTDRQNCCWLTNID